MSSTCCLLSLIKTLSWQFGGGIDFPKSFNWCILWDKLSRLPSRCVLFRLEGSGFKFFLRIFKYARWYTTLRRFLEEPSSLLVRPRLRLLLLKTVLTCCTGKGIRPALPHQGIDVSFFKQTGHEPSKIANPNPQTSNPKALNKVCRAECTTSLCLTSCNNASNIPEKVTRPPNWPPQKATGVRKLTRWKGGTHPWIDYHTKVPGSEVKRLTWEFDFGTWLITWLKSQHNLARTCTYAHPLGWENSSRSVADAQWKSFSRTPKLKFVKCSKKFYIQNEKARTGFWSWLPIPLKVSCGNTYNL